MSRGRNGFNAAAMFAGGVPGGIWLPENSDVGVGSGVGTVTDTSGNGKNATQATAANKPILRQNATTGALYWEFDGLDDWLQTGFIDMSGVDAVTVFAAVRKLSDAAAAVVCEFTNTPGNFSLFAPSAAAANYGFRVRGAGAGAVATATTYTAPHSAILTAYGDISADQNVLRVNGAQAATSAVDQGTGNLGNLQLFIGRRDGSSLPLNAHLYGLIVVGKVCTAAEITAAEASLNARIGAY